MEQAWWAELGNVRRETLVEVGNRAKGFQCPVSLKSLQCNDPLTPGPSSPRGRGEGYPNLLISQTYPPRPLGEEGPGGEGINAIKLSTIS
jgi:hypothetical protein